MAGEGGATDVCVREGLAKALDQAMRGANDDDVLRALQADPTSAQFASDRLHELIEAALRSEQEHALQEAQAKILQLQHENSVAQAAAETTRKELEVTQGTIDRTEAERREAELRADREGERADGLVAKVRAAEESLEVAETAVGSLESKCEAFRRASIDSKADLEKVKANLHELQQNYGSLHDEKAADEARIQRLQEGMQQAEQIAIELKREREERASLLQKYTSMRSKAESVAASLRRSEQQRIKLATKYASVGAKVESLVRAEEDYSAQAQSRLSSELEAARSRLIEQRRAHATRVEELRDQLAAAKRSVEVTTASSQELEQRLRTNEQRLTRMQAEQEASSAAVEAASDTNRTRLATLEARIRELTEQNETSARQHREREQALERQLQEQTAQARARSAEQSAAHARSVRLQVRTGIHDELRRIHSHYQRVLRSRLANRQQAAQRQRDEDAQRSQQQLREFKDRVEEMKRSAEKDASRAREEIASLRAQLSESRTASSSALAELEAFRGSKRGDVDDERGVHTRTEYMRRLAMDEADRRIETERGRAQEEATARVKAAEAERDRVLHELKTTRESAADLQLREAEAQRIIGELGGQLESARTSAEAERQRRTSLCTHLDEASRNIARLTSIVDDEQRQRAAAERTVSAQIQRVQELEEAWRRAEQALDETKRVLGAAEAAKKDAEAAAMLAKDEADSAVAQAARAEDDRRNHAKQAAQDAAAAREEAAREADERRETEAQLRAEAAASKERASAETRRAESLVAAAEAAQVAQAEAAAAIALARREHEAELQAAAHEAKVERAKLDRHIEKLNDEVEGAAKEINAVKATNAALKTARDEAEASLAEARAEVGAMATAEHDRSRARRDRMRNMRRQLALACSGLRDEASRTAGVVHSEMSALLAMTTAALNELRWRTQRARELADAESTAKMQRMREEERTRADAAVADARESAARDATKAAEERARREAVQVAESADAAASLLRDRAVEAEKEMARYQVMLEAQSSQLSESSAEVEQLGRVAAENRGLLETLSSEKQRLSAVQADLDKATERVQALEGVKNECVARADQIRGVVEVLESSGVLKRQVDGDAITRLIDGEAGFSSLEMLRRALERNRSEIIKNSAGPLSSRLEHVQKELVSARQVLESKTSDLQTCQARLAEADTALEHALAEQRHLNLSMKAMKRRHQDLQEQYRTDVESSRAHIKKIEHDSALRAELDAVSTHSRNPSASPSPSSHTVHPSSSSLSSVAATVPITRGHVRMPSLRRVVANEVSSHNPEYVHSESIDSRSRLSRVFTAGNAAVSSVRNELHQVLADDELPQLEPVHIEHMDLSRDERHSMRMQPDTLEREAVRVSASDTNTRELQQIQEDLDTELERARSSLSLAETALVSPDALCSSDVDESSSSPHRIAVSPAHALNYSVNGIKSVPTAVKKKSTQELLSEFAKELLEDDDDDGDSDPALGSAVHSLRSALDSRESNNSSIQSLTTVDDDRAAVDSLRRSLQAHGEKSAIRSQQAVDDVKCATDKNGDGHGDRVLDYAVDSLQHSLQDHAGNSAIQTLADTGIHGKDADTDDDDDDDWDADAELERARQLDRNARLLIDRGRRLRGQHGRTLSSSTSSSKKT